jgi:predicted nucleic acid-binding protein
MKDKVFLDTNILIYGYSNTEVEKQTIARKLITELDTFISTQVLQELTNVVTKKFKYNYIDAANLINETCQNNKLHINTNVTLLKACNVAERFKFSFYDSLIIAAAIETNCTILYTEDLNHNQTIFDTITIINPFI